MRALSISMVMLSLGQGAFAQQAFAPVERDLFEAMAHAISDVPMPLNSHNQVQGIISNVQREAQARAVARMKEEEAKGKGEGKP